LNKTNKNKTTKLKVKSATDWLICFNFNSWLYCRLWRRPVRVKK